MYFNQVKAKKILTKRDGMLLYPKPPKKCPRNLQIESNRQSIGPFVNYWWARIRKSFGKENFTNKETFIQTYIIKKSL